ncbi:MAG: hypothetical protein E7466_04210 [Ruminococcaceae bacterium]|nr:hypothetical protein [Oscillospiraceae bacterium]
MAGQYQFGKQKELDELTDRILNREKFSYDLNGDAFYNQYKDKFTQQGKLAMMDTMGQAAALTGGYGSSYAQQVGQQTYQGYLQGLNDKVPELYQLALDNYDRQGDALTQQYGLLADLDAKDYSRHRDAVADAQWQTGNKQSKNPSGSGTIAQIGGTLGNVTGGVAAGVTAQTAKKNSGLGAGIIKMLQRIIGTTEDGVWDENDSRACGGRTAQDAYQAYQRGQLQAYYQPDRFTGTTYDAAVTHMKKLGVPGNQAAAVLSEREWKAQRAAYEESGEGVAEVTDYSSYVDYLNAYIRWAQTHKESVATKTYAG